MKILFLIWVVYSIYNLILWILGTFIFNIKEKFDSIDIFIVLSGIGAIIAAMFYQFV